MHSLEQQFRLADIEVNRSTLDEKIIGVFRYESESRNKHGPVFLLLVEITSTAYVYEQLLDVLNATAEQARRLTVGFDTDPMARFEKVIQRLNEAIALFAQESPTPLSWNRVNLFAIELSEAHLCFSGTGRLMNVFLQKQDNGTYRHFDLFGSLEQPAEVDPKKVFSSLVCGDIRPGDLLMAGTLNFERLRGELRLVDRLSTLPPVTAALEIRQDLEHRDIPDDFAAVVIASVELPRLVSEPVTIPDEREKPKSTQSIERMYQAEEATQEILSPAMPVSKRIATYLSREYLERFGQQALKKIKALVNRAPNSLHNPVALASLRGMNAGHGSFMTPKRRLTLLAGGGIVLAAIIGTIWFQQAKKASAEQTLWNATYDQAVDRKNRAEADLVYNNEEHARRLVQEATELLASLDDKKASRKQAKEELQRELNVVLTKLKHETRVEKPTEIFALPAGSNQGLLSISLYKGNLLSVDKAGQSVVQVNPSTREIKRIALTGDQTNILAGAASKDSLLYITATATLLSIDPVAGKVNERSYSPLKVDQPISASLYNKRLYMLDPKNGMIWRFGVVEGGGFGSESAYLKQTNTTLSDAQGIAIDSSVYVTLKNGSVVRYLSGVQEPWTLNQVEPAMTSAAGIWT
ncbi:hypothetical protein FJZ48_03425, partial [Candidatus Uhrbacteria bacterium]|nr:hypothetical protein [Candidatus Uhrbacteria bacterium]